MRTTSSDPLEEMFILFARSQSEHRPGKTRRFDWKWHPPSLSPDLVPLVKSCDTCEVETVSLAPLWLTLPK
jgi:hypothetical protein